MKGLGKVIIFALVLILTVSCTEYLVPIGMIDSNDGDGSHSHLF